MDSNHERKGLVKVYWHNIRERVAKVEPLFTNIVDELSPDKTFPLYLAYLPYGSLQGDTESTFLPKSDGGFYRLTDPNIPKDIYTNLGYGRSSSPFGLVLEKELEFFIDLKNEGITIPWSIYTPGTFFSYSRNLKQNNPRTYAPNSVLSISSGARSAFILPNIGIASKHVHLQRDFNIKSKPPKSLYYHWDLFKEIINSGLIECEWHSCIMYFSEKWINTLHKDKTWVDLKLYLHEQAWNSFEYDRCRIYYDVAFSIIQKQRNLKPNPYLSDTARHLFTIALGEAPGYVPTCNDNALPFEVLQKIFVESYGLKKYLPTIMKPTTLKFERDDMPVYYSLQNPSTFVFSPKSREVSSTLSELRELEYIMSIFVHELSKDKTMCSDTIMCDIAKAIQFNYFHNQIDHHHVVKPSTEIVIMDKRFNYINQKYKVKEAIFASDAPFIRGCISVRKKP